MLAQYDHQYQTGTHNCNKQVFQHIKVLLAPCVQCIMCLHPNQTDFAFTDIPNTL